MSIMRKQGQSLIPQPKIGRNVGAQRLTIGSIFCSFWLSACASTIREPNIPSALDPQGPAAANIATLWWIMFWLGTAVFLGVTGLLLFILFTHRRPGPRLEPDLHTPGHRRWIWWGGVIVPSIILATTLFFTLRSHIALAFPPTTNWTFS